MVTNSKSRRAATTSPGVDIDKMARFVRAKASAFLKDPNITSVGIGYKTRDGKPTNELAIQFTVRQKVQPELLSEVGSELIPEHIEIDGVSVPTDILERSFKPAFTVVEPAAKDERKGRADVLRPGLSIGNIVTTAGTLGCFARQRGDGRVVMLSNWHVLHGANVELGVDVVQPGRHDDNRIAQNVVGKLLRSHLGPAGDCAIASITSRSYANEVIGLGSRITQIGRPALNDKVMKSGRTTGVTRGVIKRIEVNTQLTYPGGVSAQIGGFEIGLDPKYPQPDGELTKGGDSGSAWLAATSKGKDAVMLGLHFAGNVDDTDTEYALACYAESVMTALDIEPLSATAVTQIEAEAVSEQASGFDANFLPFRIGLPTFTRSAQKDLADVEGDAQLRYCHFSVWLSRSRRYARCAAWNVDGGNLKVVKDRGFRLDRRDGLDEFQLGEEAYRGNSLDQGHLARRADVAWGSLEVARQASYDSCYYPNITPQHFAFNRSSIKQDDPRGGLWGRLENTLLDSALAQDLRFSVMAGPVFGRKDRRFLHADLEFTLPDEFWKVVVYRDAETGEDRSYGFLLSQGRLLGNLAIAEGIPLEEWAWAQISLRELENKTGVTFPASIKKIERVLSVPEALDAGGPALRLILSDDQFFI